MKRNQRGLDGLRETSFFQAPHVHSQPPAKCHFVILRFGRCWCKRYSQLMLNRVHLTHSGESNFACDLLVWMEQISLSVVSRALHFFQASVVSVFHETIRSRSRYRTLSYFFPSLEFHFLRRWHYHLILVEFLPMEGRSSAIIVQKVFLD